LQCPDANCRREAIAAVPHDVHAQPKLLTRSAARGVGRRIVLGQRRAALIVTSVLASGSLAFGGFLALWQFLVPSSGGNSWLAYFALFAVGIVGAIVIAAVFAASIVLGAERWVLTLHRADLVFGRAPDLYRR
jgi:hypothetical protein